MSKFWCVECGRPEGDLHKSECKFNTGDLVSWYDYDQELKEAWLREQQLEQLWGHG